MSVERVKEKKKKKRSGSRTSLQSSSAKESDPAVDLPKPSDAGSTATSVSDSAVRTADPGATADDEEVKELTGRDFKLGELKKRGWRSNSTNSLYIRETLHAPDENALVRCMAVSALKIFEYSMVHPAKPRYPKKAYLIFEEDGGKASSRPANPKLPSEEELTRLIKSIVEAGDLAPQSCVLFVLFLGRLKDRMPLTPLNWKRIILSSLILGCKVWEDEAVWNSDFDQLFPKLDNKTLGQLEKQLLTVLGYHCTMTAGEYAECFFAMKELVPTALPDKPLSAEDVIRLEERSAETEKLAREQKPISRSVDINSKGNVISPYVPRR